MQEEKLPRRIVVAEVLSSRYSPGSRPVSWDDRSPGVESIRTKSGEDLTLYSNGGQSTPGIGWELLLVDSVDTDQVNTEASGHGSTALSWTLYGIPAN